MTQGSTVVSTAPPLPGLQLVQQINTALETIGTNFAGPDDPAALAGPFMTWADTANSLLKRRNAAGTAWVAVGPLLGDVARLAGSATQRFSVAPSQAAAEATAQSQVFGVGQTYQTMGGARAAGVTYTNSTGKPIFIAVSGTINADINYLVIFINSRVVAAASIPLFGGNLGANAVVPNGASYSAEVRGVVLTEWRELRG